MNDKQVAESPLLIVHGFSEFAPAENALPVRRRLAGTRTINGAMRIEHPGTRIAHIPSKERPVLTLLFDDQTEPP